MSNRTPQNLSNYKRYDPLFHLFILPITALVLLATIVHLVMRPSPHAMIHLVLALALLAAIYKLRIYPLRVQDRIIRLEERLRLATLIDPALRPRISELTEAQLIALRFASDPELPTLAARALNEKLSPEDIKKSIQTWRPDHFRL